MLKVKTKLKESSINGLGLFADEDIPKGTVTWQYDKDIDISFDPDEVEKMPEDKKTLIKKYAFLSVYSGKYIYSIDDSRFINHSQNKYNVSDSVENNNTNELVERTNRDIKKGEELLANYRQFDKNDAISDEEYLNN